MYSSFSINNYHNRYHPMSAFVSKWVAWHKSPETGIGGTAKTDRTPTPRSETSTKTDDWGTAKTDRTLVAGEKCAEMREHGTVKTDKTSRGAPLTPSAPCTVCGNTRRWNDAGLWRCGTCWPTPLTAAARVAEAHPWRKPGADVPLMKGGEVV